jgi:neutral amino acid transport system permease protein
MVETGLANAILTGIVTGSIIALGAIGLALVYSIAEVPNFAHGDLLMVGAYVALFVNKPGTLPVLELASTGPRSVSIIGSAVLFVLAVVSTLGVVYQLGGVPALKGSWWPSRPSPAVAMAAHGLLALLVGAIVLVSLPSLWGGLVLAAVVMGNVAPITEQLVFRKFRARDATLATMLIVSLGVSFILRFGTQAIFGGAFRSYRIDRTIDLFGGIFYVSAAKFFDVYVAGNGVVLRIIDSGPPGDPVAATTTYGWPFVLLGGLAVVGAAVGGYRWRSTDQEAVRTFGPRLAALVFGSLTALAAALLLGGAGSVPSSPLYSTRFRVFPIKTGIVLVAIGMMATLHVLLQETKLGKAMRASSDNLDLAKVTGINTDRVMMATWIMAGLFAGIAGVLLGLTVRVQVNVGFFLLLPMFAAAILGGIRSVYGVIIGAYVVGLSMDVGFYLLPLQGNQYRIAIAFVVLFVVLLAKPEGIVGGGS